MQRVTSVFKNFMTYVAGFIDHWSGGSVKPAHITALSLLGHIPVAWALVDCRPVLAAILLAFFASLDALDGALARVQNSASRTGLFFDAVSDRIKEVIVFSALAVYVYKHIDVQSTWLVVAALGTSILVSYTKAKGEMALDGKIDAQVLNRRFSQGIASYEVRTVALIVGLLFGWIEYVLPLLIAANAITIALRFITISKELYELDQTKKPRSKK